MEFLLGIATIVGVAKLGEMLVELARSRGMGAKGDMQALRHEIQSLRQELADHRAASRQAHPLAVAAAPATTRYSHLPAEDIFAPAAQPRREPASVLPAPQTKPAEDVATQVARLQQEMHALRDTTTQFDMSFDSAVDRLERRLAELDAQKDAPRTVSVGAQR